MPWDYPAPLLHHESAHLSESRGNSRFSRTSGNHVNNFGIEDVKLAERRIKRELLVARRDGLGHTLEVDLIDARTRTPGELHA